jgi:hypothetical protein
VCEKEQVVESERGGNARYSDWEGRGNSVGEGGEEISGVFARESRGPTSSQGEQVGMGERERERDQRGEMDEVRGGRGNRRGRKAHGTTRRVSQEDG